MSIISFCSWWRNLISFFQSGAIQQYFISVFLQLHVFINSLKNFFLFCFDVEFIFLRYWSTVNFNYLDQYIHYSNNPNWFESSVLLYTKLFQVFGSISVIFFFVPFLVFFFSVCSLIITSVLFTFLFCLVLYVICLIFLRYRKDLKFLLLFQEHIAILHSHLHGYFFIGFSR